MPGIYLRTCWYTLLEKHDFGKYLTLLISEYPNVEKRLLHKSDFDGMILLQYGKFTQINCFHVRFPALKCRSNKCSLFGQYLRPICFMYMTGIFY